MLYLRVVACTWHMLHSADNLRTYSDNEIFLFSVTSRPALGGGDDGCDDNDDDYDDDDDDESTSSICVSCDEMARASLRCMSAMFSHR
jgi:hypothetical protein